MRLPFFSILIFINLMFCPLSWSASIKQDLASPVTTSAAYVFWSGTAITTYLLLSEDQISDKATSNTANRKPLGDASKLGDLYGQVYPNAIYFLGMGAKGLLVDGDESYSKAGHMFRATLYAGLVTTVLKYTVREPRPDNSKEKNSFPSGHTTTAFAFATTVATEHAWYWGLLAIGGAALTGYSRMNDGRHFLHDVAAGATIGASYGLGTYFTSQGQGDEYAVAPILGPDTTGMRVVYIF